MNDTVTEYNDYLPTVQRQRSKRMAKLQSTTKRNLQKQLKRIVGKISMHIPPQPAYEPLSAIFHHGRTWACQMSDDSAITGGNGFE